MRLLWLACLFAQLFNFFPIFAEESLFFSGDTALSRDMSSFLNLCAEKGMTLTLNNPLYESGVLQTSDGGVIEGEGLYLQARCIEISDGDSLTLSAEGDIFIQVGWCSFKAERVTLDLNSRCGTIDFAVFSAYPWVVSASQVILHPGGNFSLHQAYLTTAESMPPLWSLTTGRALLSSRRIFKAEEMTFRLGTLPLFWFPSLRLNLETLEESPISFSLRWGGEQGTRIGAFWDVIALPNFTATLMGDFRFKRGPGAGLETLWCNPNHLEYYETKNYFGLDNSVEDPSQQIRFRFQGVYERLSRNGDTSVFVSYDKLSDKYMATDYNDQDLTLRNGEVTELRVTHAESWGMTNLIARPKINSFQTIKQELPTLTSMIYPYQLRGGWFFDAQLQGSFLDFQYTSGVTDSRNYQAGRFLTMPRLWRASQYNGFATFVSAEPIALFYTDSPQENAAFLAALTLEAEASLRFIKRGESARWTLEPYSALHYTTAPTISPLKHYVFDPYDGYVEWRSIEAGCRLDEFVPSLCGDWSKALHAAIWGILFIPQESIQVPFPKLYSEVTCFLTSSCFTEVECGWDFQNQLLDHLNMKLGLTLNENLAFDVQYRKRSPYAWRKMDPQSYFLELFHSQEDLLDSSLSDKRETLLFHGFSWLRRDFGLELELRHGWGRDDQPVYTEYQISAHVKLRSLWQCKASYQKREDDHRFAVYLSINLDRPRASCYSGISAN